MTICNLTSTAFARLCRFLYGVTCAGPFSGGILPPLFSYIFLHRLSIPLFSISGFVWRPFRGFQPSRGLSTALSPPLLRFLLFSTVFVRFSSSASLRLLVFPRFRWFFPSLHLIRPSSVPASSDLIQASHHHVSCPCSWFLHHSSSLVHLRALVLHRRPSLSNLENSMYMLLQLPLSVTRSYYLMSATSSSRHHLRHRIQISLSSSLTVVLLAFCWHFVFSSLQLSPLYRPLPVFQLHRHLPPFHQFPCRVMFNHHFTLKSFDIIATISSPYHLYFCHCRRVHSLSSLAQFSAGFHPGSPPFPTPPGIQTLEVSDGRSLRGCVGISHVTFIKRPRGHFPSLRSSLIFVLSSLRFFHLSMDT